MVRKLDRSEETKINLNLFRRKREVTALFDKG